MPTFSKISEERLRTCHDDLQRVARAAIKRFDFCVLQGHRSKEHQHDAFVDGKSKLDWPNSKHNKTPSRAMDLAPYPIDWSNEDSFRQLATIVLEEAAKLGVELVWGGTFKTLVDLPHFELAGD